MRRSLLLALLCLSCGRTGVERPSHEEPAPFPAAIPTPEHGLYFDGDDRVYVGPSALFDVDAFTVEVWALPDDLGSEMHLLAHHSDQNNEGWLLYIRNQRAEFRIYDGAQHDCTPAVTLTEGEWHHFAGTFDGDRKLTVFVDGMVLATRMTPASTTPASFAGPLGFGISTDGGGFRFSGILDEARLSSGVRYSESFTPPADRFEPDADTLALWHLDEPDTALDSGGNQLDGTFGVDPLDPALVALPPISSR